MFHFTVFSAIVVPMYAIPGTLEVYSSAKPSALFTATHNKNLVTALG